MVVEKKMWRQLAGLPSFYPPRRTELPIAEGVSYLSWRE
jgi:hypothetical protein